MNPTDFTLLVFDNITFVALLSAVLVLLLYIATYRIAGGFLDPFHYFYSFTYGTAYAVVGLLAYTGYIGIKGLSIVVGYGLVFLIGYIFFSRTYFSKVWSTNRLFSLGGKTMLALALILYFTIALIFLYEVGFAAFLPSRYGVGEYNLFALIMDPLRLFIAAYIAVMIVNRHNGGRKISWLICVELLFIIFSSLINGSKFSFLESIYAGSVAVAIGLDGMKVHLKKIIKPALLILLVATVYAVGQEYLNIEASGGTENNQSYDLYTKGPLLLDLFAIRIVNNGDIYYYILPETVFHTIVIDHPFAVLFRNIFGEKIVASLFGIDMTQVVDLGHQSTGYWYGAYDADVGPVDHFDLDAYKFFGPFGGILFVICLAFIISSINKLKKGHYDIAGSATVAALYIRSLTVLLSPSVGIAFIEESFILFGLLSILARILNSAARIRQHAHLT
jgi:hypothetical protein